MNWKEVCESPELQNLPFKLELNKDGEVVMNAVQVNHALFAGKIIHFLEIHLPNGYSLPEFPVMTSDNVKSPDVVWISGERLEQVKGLVAANISPEICVEVKSPHNTWKKLYEKAQLYFEQSALEVWFCNEQGAMTFTNLDGPIQHSELPPTFPQQLEL